MGWRWAAFLWSWPSFGTEISVLTTPPTTKVSVDVDTSMCTNMHMCTDTHSHTHDWIHIRSFSQFLNNIHARSELSFRTRTGMNTKTRTKALPHHYCPWSLHGNKQMVYWGAATIPWCFLCGVVNFNTFSVKLSSCQSLSLFPLHLSSLLSVCLFLFEFHFLASTETWFLFSLFLICPVNNSLGFWHSIISVTTASLLPPFYFYFNLRN